ncbi:hypothetical protein JVU11DRAFT_10545 [Chiua virens]|nr:hypothetical protein JVU11DRAFT_10545 [Chiua virens]
MEPPQTLIITPSSLQYSHGRYDCTIVSQTTDSDWPSGGPDGAIISPTLLLISSFETIGHLVVQLCLVFHVLSINTFFTYVQRFHVGTVDAASGLHPLKCMTRRDRSHIRDIILLSHIRSPAQIIPCFGKAANPHLNAGTSYELSSDFWLNKYWNKQFYYSLML